MYIYVTDPNSAEMAGFKSSLSGDSVGVFSLGWMDMNS